MGRQMRHETWAKTRNGHRIHIFGPAGSGTSTLGRALANALATQHFDCDDFYWLPTDPAFQVKRPVPDRLALMEQVFVPRRDWILSGSMEGWGRSIAPRITLGIRLTLDREHRRVRLERREALRCDCGRGWGQPFCTPCTAFLCWADGYEQGDRPGRSLKRDLRWAKELDCPVLDLDSRRPAAELVQITLDRLQQISVLT